MPKISQLPDAEAISGTEYVAIVQDGQTRKATASSLGGGGGFTAPTGTGVMTVTSGSMDAAATGTTGTGDFARATSPTFVSPVLGAATGTSVALSSYWSTGATPATTGAGRMSNNEAIYGRNAANSANIRLVYLTNGNVLQIGQASAGGNGTLGLYATTTIETHAGTLSMYDDTGGDTRCTVTSSSFQLYKPLRLIDSGGDHSYQFTPSDLAADRNVTLPLLTGNDTFVFQSHTQTLANKTFSDSVSIGTGTLASSGHIRFGGTAATSRIKWHDGTADRDVLVTETGGNGVIFGNTSHSHAYYGSSVTVYASSGSTFIYGASAERLRVEANGVSIGGGAGDYGSGNKCAFFPNATTNPSTNPTGGVVVYADSGALKARGTSGTVTTMAPAEPHCPKCGGDFVFEAQNEKYGHLALCFPCLLGALDAAGVDTSAAFIRTTA